MVGRLNFRRGGHMLWLVMLKAVLSKTQATTAASDSSYRAAVVEFAALRAPLGASADEVKAAKLANVRTLEVFAAAAKANGTQILVMPEYGVTGDGYEAAGASGVFTRESVQPFLEEIPDGLTNACDQAADLPSSPVLVRMACLAKKLQMVLVFDLVTRSLCVARQNGCPGDGQRVHNTAVAVAEDGSFLAVYHKRHPFGDEHGFVDASDNGKARFTTSFGVTFGMFICFDIFWELMEDGVRDFVFPTDWVNYHVPGAPSARAAQLTWSLTHQANLLAADYGGFGNTSSGSGLYHRGRPLEWFYNPTDIPKSQLLVADIPRISESAKTTMDAAVVLV
eukprot:gnl/TRDRNA2_/TRDRNA2_154697_c0_seq2.p1 gnl/TRDRNA2_/TRDRNA2_154697_c0~~gnl/TRDRNA2_/TRDRNA2_154697_c0_seq2.p1  ORF type:complete len:352 (-),score=77.12 gnl/TRDRNA2_/TRDRNA2_154697_c0_seq2:166-1176(-)